MIDIDLIVKYSILKRYQKEMDKDQKDAFIIAGIEEIAKRIEKDLSQHRKLLETIKSDKERIAKKMGVTL